MGSLQLVSSSRDFSKTDATHFEELNAIETQLNLWNQTLQAGALPRSALETKITEQLACMNMKISTALADIHLQLQKLNDSRAREQSILDSHRSVSQSSSTLDSGNVFFFENFSPTPGVQSREVTTLSTPNSQQLDELSNTSIVIHGSVVEEPLVADDGALGGATFDTLSSQATQQLVMVKSVLEGSVATAEAVEDKKDEVDATEAAPRDIDLVIPFVQKFTRTNKTYLKCGIHCSEAPRRKDGIGVRCLTDGYDVLDGVTIVETCALTDALRVTPVELEKASIRISPSAMRDVILEILTVSWNDVGCQMEVQMEFLQDVQWPHKHKNAFDRIGTQAPSGIFMFGSPSCSKTLLARTIASAAGSNFLATKGSEFFSKRKDVLNIYVGVSFLGNDLKYETNCKFSLDPLQSYISNSSMCTRKFGFFLKKDWSGDTDLVARVIWLEVDYVVASIQFDLYMPAFVAMKMEEDEIGKVVKEDFSLEAVNGRSNLPLHTIESVYRMQASTINTLIVGNGFDIVLRNQFVLEFEKKPKKNVICNFHVPGVLWINLEKIKMTRSAVDLTTTDIESYYEDAYFFPTITNARLERLNRLNMAYLYGLVKYFFGCEKLAKDVNLDIMLQLENHAAVGVMAMNESRGGMIGDDADEELACSTWLAFLLADSFNIFRPIAVKRPNVLLPLVNASMIDYTLAWHKCAGVEEVFELCCIHSKQVIDYLENSNGLRQPHTAVSTIDSYWAMSVGAALLCERHVIRGYFILALGNTMSNVPLPQTLTVHHKRRKNVSSAVMFMIIKHSKQSPVTLQFSLGTEEMFLAIGHQTKKLLYYEELEYTDHNSGNIEIACPRENLEEHLKEFVNVYIQRVWGPISSELSTPQIASKLSQVLIQWHNFHLLALIWGDLKYIDRKFLSLDPRGRGSSSGGGIVMAHEGGEMEKLKEEEMYKAWFIDSAYSEDERGRFPFAKEGDGKNLSHTCG